MLRNPEYMQELVQRWAKECCTDFGETETGHLYTNFKAWVYRTRAMRRFPGPTAFGEAMRLAGYEKRIGHRKGLGRATLWSGIALKPETDL